VLLNYQNLNQWSRMPYRYQFSILRHSTVCILLNFACKYNILYLFNLPVKVCGKELSGGGLKQLQEGWFKVLSMRRLKPHISQERRRSFFMNERFG
jgi:hypothetical protein